MPLFGKIVVIKRNGADGIHFPLTASSCLFGRKTECDIRIQLPQVSKEHCKIEVNENKEAILTNLSNVNPTQLNSSSFQQPVHLKHGDILTIVDRSFRFEYPPQSTPRKRCSRSPKSETLQVLHVQQVAEVESLLTETARSKGPHGSDDSECEGQNAGENKQNTEENITRPKSAKKAATPKSACRTPKSIKKENKMSPFSQIYEYLKHENEINKSQSEDNIQQQTRISRCLPGQGSQIKMDAIVREDAKECKVKQNIHGLEHNQFTTEQNGLEKRFSGNHRTVDSNQKPIDLEEKNDLPLQDSAETYEQNVSRKSEVTKCIAIKLKRVSDQKTAFSPKSCTIESLGDIAQVLPLGTPIKHSTEAANEDSLTSISETTEYSASTPRSRRKGRRSHSSSSTRETNETSSISTDTSLTGQDFLLMLKQSTEIQSEIQKEGVVSKSDGNELCVLAEINKNSKQKRNCKLLTPIKSSSAEEVVKEIHDETYFASKGRDSEIHTPSPGKSSFQSTRRSGSQNKELRSKSLHSEMLSPEKVATKDASPTICKSHSGTRRGRPRTSGQQIEKALERDSFQEHDRSVDSNKEELAAKSCQQKLDLEDASIMPRCHTLSSKRCSESIVLKDDEIVSEMSACDLSAKIEKSGELKRSLQKRKSGNSDLSLQPLGKRKRVSFGGHLSPELFDKSLPPNSPLKRGAIPARLSLPFGNSPRAVLKKAQGFKRCVIKELSEHLQKKKLSPKRPPARRSPAASPPARRSPAASPVLENTSSKLSASTPSNTSFTRGRFSVSHISTPSPTSEEQGSIEEKINANTRDFTPANTLESFHVKQDHQISVPTTPKQVTRRSARFTAKRTPGKRRSGAVAAVHAKRRSGASDANLLVAKSWAEVVKLGVARPQVRTAKKYVQKGRRVKKLKLPKTPERKVKGHFSTGHADSPATIMIGRAHTTTVKMDYGQAPKVVKNSALKLCMDINESFTGMPEMFKTPVNRDQKSPSLTSGQKTDLSPMYTAMEVSELLTPEESGEMAVSPLNISSSAKQKQVNQEVVSHFLKREKSSDSNKDKAIMKKKMGTKPLIIAENKINEVTLGARSRMNTPKQETEPLETLSGAKQCMKTPEEKMEPVETLAGVKRSLRTPEQKAEPVEALSGVKRLMRTPKQKTQPVDALSGVKRLMRTPKQKTQPVDALSAVKRLMRTPKQKTQPVDALSGVKRLMRTPKQKTQPVDALSAVKRLMRTPKQKTQPVDALSAVKRLMRTPKQKTQPVDALSAVKRLMRTPKQKTQPVDALSAVKRLMRTPKQKTQPVDALSAVKRLMRTPKQKTQPVDALSAVKRLMRTPKQKTQPVDALSAVKRLMRTPKQKTQPVDALSAVKRLMRTPKQKTQPVDALSAVKRLMRTPKQKTQPVDALSAVKRLMRTPKQKTQPVDALSAVKRLMRTPKQKMEPVVDDIAYKRLFETPEERKQVGNNICGVSVTKATAKVKYQPVEDMKGIGCMMKTPKEIVRPIEDMFGISRLLRTPREKYLPVDDFVGLQKLLAEPKQKRSDSELDYVGVKEMFDVPEEKVQSTEVMDLSQKKVFPCTDSRNEHGEEKSSLCNSSEKLILSLRKRTGGQENLEMLDSIVPTKRNRRVKTEHNKQCSTNELCSKERSQRPRRNTRRAETAKCTQKDEDDFTKNLTEAVPMAELENKKAKIKVTEKKGKALKGNSRKQLAETEVVKMDSDSVGNIQEVKRISNETAVKTQAPLEETEAGNKDVGTDQSCKSNYLLSENANEVPLNVYNLQANTNPVKESNPRCRNNRGIKGVIVCKENEFSKNVKGKEANQTKDCSSKNISDQDFIIAQTPDTYSLDSLSDSRKQQHAAQVAFSGTNSLNESQCGFEREISSEEIIPQMKSDIESQKTATKKSSGTKKISKTKKDQKDSTTAVVQIVKEESAVLRRRSTRGSNKEQEAPKTNHNEMLENNPTESKENILRRGKGKKVQFQVKESSSISLRGKHAVPEDDNKEANHEDGQNETSKKIPAQANGRRGRRKQVDLVLQTATSSSVTGKSILLEDPSKDETATSSIKQNSLRSWKKEVVFTSQMANSTSLRRKHDLSEGNDKEETLQKDQNVVLENTASQTKVSASTRGRRKKAHFTQQATSSFSLRGKRGLTKSDDKNEIANEGHGAGLEMSAASTEEIPSRRGRRKNVALVSQEARSTLLQTKCVLPTNGVNEEILKEDQNTALENTTAQTRANSARRERIKKSDFTQQVASSPSVRGKCGLERNGVDTSEDQNVALEIVPSARENLSRRGRRKNAVILAETNNFTSQGGKYDLLTDNVTEKVPVEDQNKVLENTSEAKASASARGRRRKADLVEQATSSLSHRGKRGLPKNDGKEEINDNQNIVLETVPFSSEIPPRRGRRKGVVPLSQATSSTSQREKCSLSESNDQEDTHKEDKNVALENATPPEKSNPLKKKGKKKMDLLSPAAGSTVSHNQFSRPENDGKRETPKGDQNMPLEITSSAKGKSSGRGRKKKTDASTSLRKTYDLPKDSGQEETLKEDKNVALENALSHGKPDPSRRKRNKKIEVISQADNSPLFQDKTRLPEDDIKEVVHTEDQNVGLEHTTPAKEIILRKGKKKQIILPSQATSSAPLGRKRHLPEDERAAKKVKSGESGESRTLLRGRRNKTQEGNDKEDVSLFQTGIERRTRASTRTRK
ncbi:PREDICTED: proliferation marker protein Ki-67 [Gavialis gangeticus]|uniref:proliferation marker protein Ki-67 n=1 Tax=Gavialis gangeticus TaxID=94835 RepID=UPI00092F06B7|nr:PREDICTED: proliferation marker protein Ki-67 [Gavialis gangeticus]